MPSNQSATVPVTALTIIGCVLVALGLLAAGNMQIIVAGLGAVALAAVLGTVLAIFGGRGA